MKRLLVVIALVLPACRPRQELTLHFLVPDDNDPLVAVRTLEVHPESTNPPTASAPFSEGHHGSLDLSALLGPVPQTLDVVGLANDGVSVIAAGRTFPLRAGASAATVFVASPDTFVTPPMARGDGDARYGFSTTPFAGGDAVLVADGATARPASANGLPTVPDASTIVSTLAVYDATRGTYSAIDHDLSPRIFHAAAAVHDGSDSVLLIGGVGDAGPLADVVRVTRANGRFTVTHDGMLPTPLWGHTATALDDDSGVLIVGGYTDAAGTMLSPNAYVYQSGGMTRTIPLPAPRAFSVATDLRDNLAEVLVTGGIGSAGVLDDALIYQPPDQFSSPKPGKGSDLYRVAMREKRVGHSATLLADNHVLIAGGFNGTNTVSAPEVFDPGQPAFVDVQPLTQAPVMKPRQNHQAVVLADGSLLVFGGEVLTSSLEPITEVEKLVPPDDAPSIGNGSVAFPVTVNLLPLPLLHPGALGGGLALGDQSILYLTGAGSSGPDASAALFVPMP
ncbi:MAG TPA: hypothetical protein VN947_04695 [Polyangia bacterium]|nr:hypothetical protein [Polyangia bacterium]